LASIAPRERPGLPKLTFVAGEQPADLDDTVDVWQALEWAHQDSMRDAAELRKRNGVDAAIFRDRIPVRGTAPPRNNWPES